MLLIFCLLSLTFRNYVDILSEIINERSVMNRQKESRRLIIHSHDAIIKRPDRDQFDYYAIVTVNEVQKNFTNLI